MPSSYTLKKRGRRALHHCGTFSLERDDLGRVKFSDELNYPPHITLTVADTGMIKPRASASSIQRVRARSGERGDDLNCSELCSKHAQGLR
jgi:hypothetical protein